MYILRARARSLSLYQAAAGDESGRESDTEVPEHRAMPRELWVHVPEHQQLLCV